LRALHDRLEETVRLRTAALTGEIGERKRLERELLENTERDLDGYIVYYAVEGATGPYRKLDFTRATEFVDSDVHNGSTYWYAVSAVDRSGNDTHAIPPEAHPGMPPALTPRSMDDQPHDEAGHARLDGH